MKSKWTNLTNLMMISVLCLSSALSFADEKNRDGIRILEPIRFVIPESESSFWTSLREELGPQGQIVELNLGNLDFIKHPKKNTILRMDHFQMTLLFPRWTGGRLGGQEVLDDQLRENFRVILESVEPLEIPLPQEFFFLVDARRHDIRTVRQFRSWLSGKALPSVLRKANWSLKLNFERPSPRASELLKLRLAARGILQKIESISAEAPEVYLDMIEQITSHLEDLVRSAGGDRVRNAKWTGNLKLAFHSDANALTRIAPAIVGIFAYKKGLDLDFAGLHYPVDMQSLIESAYYELWKNANWAERSGLYLAKKSLDQVGFLLPQSVDITMPVIGWSGPKLAARKLDDYHLQEWWLLRWRTELVTEAGTTLTIPFDLHVFKREGAGASWEHYLDLNEDKIESSSMIFNVGFVRKLLVAAVEKGFDLNSFFDWQGLMDSLLPHYFEGTPTVEGPQTLIFDFKPY